MSIVNLWIEIVIITCYNVSKDKLQVYRWKGITTISIIFRCP